MTFLFESSVSPGGCRKGDFYLESTLEQIIKHIVEDLSGNAMIHFLTWYGTTMKVSYFSDGITDLDAKNAAKTVNLLKLMKITTNILPIHFELKDDTLTPFDDETGLEVYDLNNKYYDDLEGGDLAGDDEPTLRDLTLLYRRNYPDAPKDLQDGLSNCRWSLREVKVIEKSERRLVIDYIVNDWRFNDPVNKEKGKFTLELNLKKLRKKFAKYETARSYKVYGIPIEFGYNAFE